MILKTALIHFIFIGHTKMHYFEKKTISTLPNHLGIKNLLFKKEHSIKNKDKSCQ